MQVAPTGEQASSIIRCRYVAIPAPIEVAEFNEITPVPESVVPLAMFHEDVLTSL